MSVKLKDKLTAEQFKKNVYVEIYLTAAARQIDNNISVLEYTVNTANEEHVTVYYYSGDRKDICVTADCLSALTIDVFKKLF